MMPLLLLTIYTTMLGVVAIFDDGSFKKHGPRELFPLFFILIFLGVAAGMCIQKEMDL